MSEPDSDSTEVKPKRKAVYRGGAAKSRTYKKARAVEMAAMGLPVSEIVKATGLPRTTTRALISKFAPLFKKLPDVADYRTVKADILSAGQLAALESAFSGNKLAKASFASTLAGFEILNKAERLENNQSTENISSRTVGKLEISNVLSALKSETPSLLHENQNSRADKSENDHE